MLKEQNVFKRVFYVFPAAFFGIRRRGASTPRAHPLDPLQITVKVLPRLIYEKLLVLLNRTLLYHQHKAHAPAAFYTFHYIPFWVSQLILTDL